MVFTMVNDITDKKKVIALFGGNDSNNEYDIASGSTSSGVYDATDYVIDQVS